MIKKENVGRLLLDARMRRANNHNTSQLVRLTKMILAVDIAILVFLMVMVIQTDAEYVNAYEGLNVRARPNTESEVLEILPFATEVSGKIRKNGWMKLSDREGYLKTEFLTQQNPLDEMEFLGTWRITAYAETGSPCANGNYPTVGYTIACNSLDFGTKVFIQGLGTRTIEDRGPDWLGSEWCDLYLGDTADCIAWGDQYRDVYLIKEEMP